jgi:hypothetical protein
MPEIEGEQSGRLSPGQARCGGAAGRAGRGTGGIHRTRAGRRIHGGVAGVGIRGGGGRRRRAAASARGDSAATASRVDDDGWGRP